MLKISVQDDFNEERFLGLWYQVRWYPEPNQVIENELWDYSWDIEHHRTKNDTLVWVLNAREKGQLDPICMDTVQAETVLVRPAFYSLIHFAYPFKGANISIVYTDYDNFMVPFICYETKGSTCIRPEVSFMSRDQKPRLEDLRKGQELIKDLCVKPKAFLDKIQEVDCFKTSKDEKETI